MIFLMKSKPFFGIMLLYSNYFVYLQLKIGLFSCLEKPTG